MVRSTKAISDSYGEREAIHVLLGRFNFCAWHLRCQRLGGRRPALLAAANSTKPSSNSRLVWSNGLFFYLVAAVRRRPLYRRGYNRMATGGDIRRRYGGPGWTAYWTAVAALRSTEHTPLLIVKDFRTFRRDPQQWAQILIFCGLMVLYFTNIRRPVRRATSAGSTRTASACSTWRRSALLLCTYTGRFIYPMLSLEGRKFWILGLLPLQARAAAVGQVRLLGTVGPLPIAASWSC